MGNTLLIVFFIINGEATTLEGFSPREYDTEYTCQVRKEHLHNYIVNNFQHPDPKRDELMVHGIYADDFFVYCVDPNITLKQAYKLKKIVKRDYLNKQETF